MTRLLEGKRAIIAGASVGIGAATARLFAEHGADLMICARRETELEQVAEECRAFGRTVLTHTTDVRRSEDVNAMVDAAKDAFDVIDIAVSNAGIARDNIFLRMTDDEWDEVIETNLRGSFNVARAIGRVLRKQKAGRLIFNASLSGIHGNALQANYAASKGGVIAMAKSLAKEWLQYNVMVNCVCPGLVDTDMTRSYPERLWDKGIAAHPMGRFGSPQEIAHTILFLAGPAGAYITGKTIEIDGGFGV